MSILQDIVPKTNIHKLFYNVKLNYVIYHFNVSCYHEISSLNIKPVVQSWRHETFKILVGVIL